MRKAILIFSVLTLLLAGCRGKEGMQSSNIAHLYNPGGLNLKSSFVVEHVSDTVSRLFYRFNSNDLLYVRNNQEEKYEAKFSISYKLFPSFENTQVLDSNSYSFKDEVSQPPEKIISGYFDFKTPEATDHQYLLFINITDLSRNKEFHNFEEIDKGSLNSSQYWSLNDTSGQRIFMPHIPAGVPFLLKHKQLKPASYYVSVYQREFPLALPPYSSKNTGSFELEPDTTYKIDANQAITLPENGFYHFRLDTTQWQGFTVYSFYRHFPYVAETEQLGLPLRYLTTKSEFGQYLEAAGDPEKVKKWVDQFWLNRAGSIERSQRLISSYYQRVEHANRQFTSYVEGWRTDRGIIYVIYGPPNKVYRSSAGESWVYGNESSSLSYVFNFTKVNNPFTDNDFEMDRMPQYRYGWGQAIEAWRNGHIYNSKDIKREQDASDQAQFQRRNYYR